MYNIYKTSSSLFNIMQVDLIANEFISHLIESPAVFLPNVHEIFFIIFIKKTSVLHRYNVSDDAEKNHKQIF